MVLLTMLLVSMLPTTAQNPNETEARLKQKVQTIESKLPSWSAAGNDPALIVNQMKQFASLMESGKILEAEKALDAALSKLKESSTVQAKLIQNPAPIPFADEPQYLIFMFSGEKLYDAENPHAAIEQFAKQLKSRIGTTGTTRRKLGFAILIPPWMLDKVCPNKISPVIKAAFQVAHERNMAVFFSVDSHTQWQTRPDLWNYFDRTAPGFNLENKKNVEWCDWHGTPYPHHFIDWGTPEMLAPPLCMNAPKIQSEVTRFVSTEIAPPIKESLKIYGTGKEQLFAGITVTAEPMLENYSIVDSVNPRLGSYIAAHSVQKKQIGFNALTNNGYSERNPPKDMGAALAHVIQEFGALWARELVKAGIPSSLLYTHIAANGGVAGTVMCAFTNAPISAAFNNYCRPGWTTYAEGPLQNGFAPIYSELAKHKNPHWASSEASPASLSLRRVAPYEYLRWHFGHGATVMVMNTGATSAELSAELERGVYGPDAIAAYRRFLNQHR
jgi:hypothetical protein